jgi:urocanate reductase
MRKGAIFLIFLFILTVCTPCSFSQAVGADTLQLNFIQLYPFAEPETGILDTPAVYPFNGPGYGIVYINKLGKRFVNELERRDVCAFAQINLGARKKFRFDRPKGVLGGAEER